MRGCSSNPFDEITIDPRVAYDSTDDAVYGPNDKMQVVMVRSLCSRWKQPVFLDCKGLLHRIIAGSRRRRTTRL